MDSQYQPSKIEAAIQAFWQENTVFQAAENINREKFYCLSMFPYPSGTLHMGHVRNYALGDVIARYQRQLGKNVLQPMGWDGFGLPAENAAIKHGIPPAEWTRKNIAHMRKQFESLGLAYDWSREFATCDVNYYCWEQWFFLQLHKKGLVYRKNAEVNWDPVDQTILANEQVIDGRGWRSGALVERREIPQWFLKITAYADELLDSLDELTGWPDSVKTMQRNWIGRSEGVEITFDVAEHPESLTIYTTRPDTLFGVTYIALAPQHPLARRAAEANADVAAFLESCRNIKVAEADIATMEKQGIATGYHVIHPLTGDKLPIWVANFVLMEYGSGAVMSVPAHDQRDFEFAQRFALPIKPVIRLTDGSAHDFSQSAFTAAGVLQDSGEFSGTTSTDAARAIIHALEKMSVGTRKTHYRLRDWSISRQRYWGTPIPFIYCEHCGTVPVPEKDLPIVLPENISPQGVGSPLKTLADFVNVACPACGKPAQRETDTFDTFLESSWYYARFACRKLGKAMLDARANYWLPVDQYIGGVEHAVMHLLYARFIHKTLRDAGLVNCNEPFTRLLTQGMVLNQGIKMSKSKGNTVDPATLIDRYGADTVRTFILFAAPPEQHLEWSDSGVEGAHRFLKKLWRFAFEHRECVTRENAHAKLDEVCDDQETADSAQRDCLREIYRITEQVRADYERQQFNTVISGCMKLLNVLDKIPTIENTEADIKSWIICHGGSVLLRLLAPVAPHITQQIWQDLHYPGLLVNAPWPKSHLANCRVDAVDLVVQINGKLRSRISVPAGADHDCMAGIATADSKVMLAVADRHIKKIITVPGRLVNIVTE